MSSSSEVQNIEVKIPQNRTNHPKQENMQV